MVIDLSLSGGAAVVAYLMLNECAVELSADQAACLWQNCKHRLTFLSHEETIVSAEDSTSGILPPRQMSHMRDVLSLELAGVAWPPKAVDAADSKQWEKRMQKAMITRGYL